MPTNDLKKSVIMTGYSGELAQGHFAGKEFSYSSKRRRLVIKDLSEADTNLALLVLGAIGGANSMKATAPAEPATAPKPVEPKKETQLTLSRVEAAAEEKAAAPMTRDEASDESPVHVRPKPEEADKPARKTRTRKGRNSKKAETSEDGGLAPEEGEAMNTAPRGEKPPWDGEEDPTKVRTPDGYINNCNLANGESEETCQVCKGNCPDRKLFAQTGHGEKLSKEAEAPKEAKPTEPKKGKGDKKPIDLEVLNSKPRLRPIIVHLIELGYTTPEELLDVCEQIKGDVPVLGRVSDLADRIPRTFEAIPVDDVIKAAKG